ncbi:MAG: hypothetical protein ACI8UX_002174 [Psychromonas sp.]|jgi:hypothetical protein
MKPTNYNGDSGCFSFKNLYSFEIKEIIEVFIRNILPLIINDKKAFKLELSTEKETLG